MPKYYKNKGVTIQLYILYNYKKKYHSCTSNKFFKKYKFEFFFLYSLIAIFDSILKMNV